MVQWIVRHLGYEGLTCYVELLLLVPNVLHKCLKDFKVDCGAKCKGSVKHLDLSFAGAHRQGMVLYQHARQDAYFEDR